MALGVVALPGHGTLCKPRPSHYFDFSTSFSEPSKIFRYISYTQVKTSLSDYRSELIGAPIKPETVTWDSTLGQNSSYTVLDAEISDAAWAEIAVTPSRTSKATIPARVIHLQLTCGLEGYVHLSKDQMKQLGKYSPTSVAAADGSGYLGLVGVFQ